MVDVVDNVDAVVGFLCCDVLQKIHWSRVGSLSYTFLIVHTHE
jgi:hypothetical protein